MTAQAVPKRSRSRAAAEAGQLRVSADEKIEALSLLWQQPLAGMCVVQRGRIVFCNDRFVGMLGYTSEELGRLPAKKVLPDLLEDLAMRSVSHERRRREQDAAHPVKARRKDGWPVELECFGSSASFRGRPATLLVVIDVSARKRAEDDLKGSVRKLEATLRGTIGAISSISEIRDPYTAGHQRRVGLLAAEIGRALGLPEATNEGLLIAGEVHDVGKIGVPIEILVLPRRLSVEEFSMVKRHARFGYEMLKSVEFPWPVADAVCHHHERLDGSGYPDGLKGDEITIDARIVAVADVIESIASHRPYHPALGVSTALAELKKGSGTLFDSAVVRACQSLFSKGTDSRVAELFDVPAR